MYLNNWNNGLELSNVVFFSPKHSGILDIKKKIHQQSAYVEWALVATYTLSSC